MPSDPRVGKALEALALPIEQYRSAVATTLEEVRGHVAAGLSSANTRADRLQQELGPFAVGRIDPGRLAALVGPRESMDETALARLQRSADALRRIMTAGMQLFHIEVEPGGDLHTRVSSQLAVIGTAFAAARIAAAARSGASSGFDEHVALERFPFSQWNAAERKRAAPLVVTVTGADLAAGGLAPFLDGAQKILLIVDGPCAPAPLVRLITPAVLVIQAHDIRDLEIVARWSGASVAALVPENAARFVHDPAAGGAPWQRLAVQLPQSLPLARVGSFTTAQQLDELRQLEMLATAPPTTAPSLSRSAEPAGDPADRLAVWLLQQASLAAARAVE